MAAVQLSVDLEDLRLAEAIRDAVDRARSRPLMEELAAGMKAQTRDRFQDQRGPDGADWERSQRAKDQGPRGKTLMDTRHLFKSIVGEAGPMEARVGTNRLDAAIHQFGGEAGRNRSVTLAARPYLGLSKGDKVELEDMVADYVRRVVA